LAERQARALGVPRFEVVRRERDGRFEDLLGYLLRWRKWPAANAQWCREAIVRCPMLHVNPKMLGRLDELETDLVARRQRAELEGWTGEAEGIDLTLTFLRSKREDAQRRIRRPAAGLTIQRLSNASRSEEDTQ